MPACSLIVNLAAIALGTTAREPAVGEAILVLDIMSIVRVKATRVYGSRTSASSPQQTKFKSYYHTAHRYLCKTFVPHSDTCSVGLPRKTLVSSSPRV